MKDFFIIYETTNIVNGKKYRGIHKTSNLDDGYLGSGVALKNAFKKYGKDNFKKEIIEYCNSYDELIEKEKIYVDDDWVKNNSNYNLKSGGQSTGILSNKSRKKLSDTLKRKYEIGELIPAKPNLGKPMKTETKNKISETLKTKYKIQEHPSKGKTKSSGSWEKGNIPWNKGLEIGPMKEEDKKKRSDALKKLYKNKTHHRKGKPSWNKGLTGGTPWNKGKEMPKIECPHCRKMVDKWNGKRWHFDKCKLKKRNKSS